MSSKKHGASCHWLIERITAIALIPLCVWLVIKLVSAVGADVATATAFVQNPLNAILLAAFIVVGFWHTSMGVGVVIEDYVHDTKKQKSYICVVKIISAVLALASLAAIAKLALA